MKIFSALFVLMVFTSFVQAQDIYVNTFDQDIDPAQIKEINKDIHVTQGTGKYTSQIGRLPSSADLDKILKDVGFGDEVLGMDQMDKDIFVLKVHRYEPSYFKTKYPNIDIEKIKKLKSMMGDK